MGAFSARFSHTARRRGSSDAHRFWTKDSLGAGTPRKSALFCTSTKNWPKVAADHLFGFRTSYPLKIDRFLFRWEDMLVRGSTCAKSLTNGAKLGSNRRSGGRRNHTISALLATSWSKNGAALRRSASPNRARSTRQTSLPCKRGQHPPHSNF